jgi:HK97 family phage prohead protease
MGMNFDFSGWATVNDMLCADGRTIRRNAFKENDGATVPLVWNHDHKSPANVLGHALLENRAEGMWAYCKLNDTDMANTARTLIEHGDIDSLSIYANHLKQIGGDVYHGEIKEVSLVLAGANPGAHIVDVNLAHSDDEEYDAQIFNGEQLFFAHSDEPGEKSLGEIFESMSDEQKDAVYKLVALSHSDDEDEPEDDSEDDDQDYEDPEDDDSEDDDSEDEDSEDDDDEEMEHSDDEDESDDGERTVGDVLDELTEEQKNVVYALVGQAIQDTQATGSTEEEEDVKHNIFDSDTMDAENVLSHDDMMAIMADGEQCGSLKKAALAHGITDIDYLFPDAKTLDNPPGFISRDQEWVSELMGATHHTPFSRIKTIQADITADEARAKGYIKGHLKKEEVIKLLRRTTEPVTVYKKQKLDRDDVFDITDFDVVAWLKGEMRVMLNEEIARAVLIGDGRADSDEDKINEEKVRPIASDADLYTIKQVVTEGETVDDTVKNFIRAAVKARKDYKGSGNPTLYAPEDVITDALLVEDKIGRRLYETEQQLAAALRVKKMVSVPVMENATLTVAGTVYDIMGVIVNPIDYNIGADKGGAVSLFDDFDIDYNKQIYLIETRMSGALIKPYSAIVLLKAKGSASSDDEAQG